MPSDREAGDDEPKSAMVLTEDEWKALRQVAGFFLDQFPGDDVDIFDERAIAKRIMEATDD